MFIVVYNVIEMSQMVGLVKLDGLTFKHFPILCKSISLLQCMVTEYFFVYTHECKLVIKA